MIRGSNPDTDKPVYPDVPAAIHSEIYELADWMMDAEPWLRMTDSVVIAVNDPNSGAPCLLSVMGNAGELFALHVYLPNEGTRWYCRLSAEGETPENFSDAQFNQRLVSITFDDGFDDHIDEHDEDLDGFFAPESWEDGIGENKLDFVQLRSHLPGRPPWHPDEEHARILLTGLRLFKRYYEEVFQNNPGPTFYLDALGSDGGECVMLPTYTLPAGADADDPKQWKYAVEAYTCPPPAPFLSCPPDDVFVGRLATKPVDPASAWEIGAIYISEPFLRDGTPCYAIAAFVALRSAGTVHGLSMSAADQCAHTRMRECLEATANELGVLPSEILVGSDIAHDAFSDLAASRDITLTRTESEKEMPSFHAAAVSMSKTLAPDGAPSPVDDLALEEVAKLRSMMEKAPSPEDDPEGFTDFLKKLSELPMMEPLIKAFMESQAPDFDELFDEDDEED